MADLELGKVGRKYTLEKALAVSPFELMKMNTKQRAELAQFLRSQYILRMNTFRKAGMTGYAQIKLEEDMAEAGERMYGMNMSPTMNIITTNKRKRYLVADFADQKRAHNPLATYVTLMQGYFKAKTSTVKGWKSVGEEQDRRLFGERIIAIKPGRKYKKRTQIKYVKDIAHRMSDKERIMFWKVFREAYKTDWVNIHSYSSNDQREFASIWMTEKFNHLDFEEAFARMSSMLNERPDYLPEHPPGVWDDPTALNEEGGNNINDVWG